MVAALVALLAMLPAGAAHAAGAGQVTSPANGATITSATGITVQVTGRAGSVLDPRDHVVWVRLADRSGATAVGQAVQASCADNCGGDSTWTAPALDPGTMAPFGGPVCNGGYTIQVQVDDGAWTGHPIRLARAPHAPRDVAVTPGTEAADVTWGAAPDGDVAGYRVERRASGGSWKVVGTTGAGARGLADADAPAGSVEYRVSTLRGDGLVGGAPADPCADTEPDLATPSAPVATTVRAPAGSTSDGPTSPARPTPTPSSGSGSGSGGDGDDGSAATGGDGSGSGGDGTGDDVVADDSGGDAQPGADDTASDGGSAPARRPGNRVAPPTAVGTVTNPSVTVPDAPRADSPLVATGGERYYGEGEEFSEEMDFGDLGAVEALPEDAVTTETRVIRVPGALQSVLGEELALNRVLAPVAGGLIMLAFGLHLRRWTRDGLDG